jgi:predicted nucleic acid-binding protein
LILADSSAWIDFLRATGSPADRALSALVGGAELATTDVVLMEVLAGARDEDYEVRLKRLLYSCAVVPVEGPLDYESAAELYRHCRARGATIRRLNDCLIAAVAVRVDALVLHRDRDFDVIAAHSTLRVA